MPDELKSDDKPPLTFAPRLRRAVTGRQYRLLPALFVVRQ